MLLGGAGDDSIFGDHTGRFENNGRGDDTLRGGTGNDAIFGGLGRDALFGDAGDDNLRGGRGLDTIDGSGVDLVAYNFGGLNPEPAGVRVDLAAGRAVTADGVETLTGIERVSGADIASVLLGDAGDNGLFGGDDDGGLGDDVLAGGLGDDTFVSLRDDEFGDPAGGDRVLDFVAGARSREDRIDVSDRGIDGLAITQREEGAHVAFDDRSGVLLVGVDADELVAGDFVFAA